LQACRSIGYCPQFDATLGELTGRETLSIMARIRGVIDVNHAVEAVIVAVGIEMHANKLIHKYRRAFCSINRKLIDDAFSVVAINGV
jgi:ATP-binding cassette subfamily A (ABC1) protein 3